MFDFDFRLFFILCKWEEVIIMKIVKEVSILSGVSVCILYYYDKIGLFLFIVLFEVGYWFYDDEVLICL